MKRYHLLKKQLSKLKESFSIFTVKIERQKKGGEGGRMNDRREDGQKERERETENVNKLSYSMYCLQKVHYGIDI